MENFYLSNDKLIREIGKQLIEQYKQIGVVPGLNGPYNDEETIVRNLSHLIVITSLEIILFSQSKLIDQLNDMGDTLLNLKQKDGTYILRKSHKRDSSNGVIGHAWVIEAYLYLYKVLKNVKFIKEALDIYRLHKFDVNLGLWRRPKTQDNNGSIDFTLNHQLWFAGVSASLWNMSKDSDMIVDLKKFFLTIDKLITTDSNGLICHSILLKENKLSSIKSSFKRNLDIFRRKVNIPSYNYKELGYHIFNIAALARLFLVFSDHSFWKSKKFDKIIEKTNSYELFNNIQTADISLDISLRNQIKNTSEKQINIYGFPYNVPGFEMSYIYEVFKYRINKDLTREYFNKQLELTFDKFENKFIKNCFDKVTINYRIYEYYLAMEVRDCH